MLYLVDLEWEGADGQMGRGGRKTDLATPFLVCVFLSLPTSVLSWPLMDSLGAALKCKNANIFNITSMGNKELSWRKKEELHFVVWITSWLCTPTLPFCLFSSRNSWLGRLKWWLVFSSSSYLCQCSGPCLISRYSTVCTALQDISVLLG